MFIHFGINTFNEVEWSDGKLPVTSYNPDKLNPDQWIKVAKEAGFRYVILVTKHHDGFCLWNSKYTEYDVAASLVKTDVVAEVAKACKKYGVQLGLYYSLWDRHEPTHQEKDSRRYVDYMKNQLTELLSNYGPVCELWFDGGGAKKESDWKLPEVYAHIKKLQPQCMVTTNHTIRPAGEPHGIQQPEDMQKGDTIRFFPSDFRTKDPRLARWDDPKFFTHEGKQHYLIFEHTLCLSERWNWFQKKANLPARPLDELEELFYWCTANNNIMIMNVPPDQHGLIREHERLRILALADRLGIRNGKQPLPGGYQNIAFNTPASSSSSQNNTNNNNAAKANDFSLETYWVAADSVAWLDIDLPGEKAFNRITIFEHSNNHKLGDGFSTIRNFSIKSYSIDIFKNNEWITVETGNGIGACKIISLPELKFASKIRLNVRGSHKGMPAISHIAVSNSSTRLPRKITQATHLWL